MSIRTVSPTPSFSSLHRGVSLLAALALVAAALVLAAPRADAFGETDVCFVIADGGGVASGGVSGNDRLVKINRTTGVSTSIGTTTGTNNIEAAAFWPGTDTLYASNQDGSTGRFGTVSLSTGLFAEIGTHGQATGTLGGSSTTIDVNDVDSMAMDPLTGIIYGALRRNGDPDILLAFQRSDGDVIANAFGPGQDFVVIPELTVGGQTVGDIDGLTIDPFDGIMYGIANNGGGNDRLVRINKATGAITDVGQLLDGATPVEDMEGLGNYNDGSLFGATGAGTDLWDIDKTSGAVSNERNISIGSDHESVDCLVGDTNKIQGTVYLDSDGDGVLDGGEAGPAGSVVRLYRDADNSGTVSAGDPLVATQTTDGSGDYEFEVAATGAFVLDVDPSSLPADATLTTDNIEVADFGTNVGQTDANNNFGYRTPASIGDRVWVDGDGDGVQDAGEPGIPGVEVILTEFTLGLITTDTTDGNGNYDFGNLPPGLYAVTINPGTLPPAVVATFDRDGGLDGATLVPLASGQNPTDVDFGYRGTASIGDRLWYDTDGDGTQDIGETGISGVTVQLRDSGGTIIATDVTDGGGIYGFANLMGGTYDVTIDTSTLPAGYGATYDLDGSNDSAAAVPLNPGQNRTDVDFGYRGIASIGDRLWFDTDGDGTQDAGEASLSGVTVELRDAFGSIVTTDVTDGGGIYGFGNLDAGTYNVTVDTSTLPAGVTETYDLDGGNDSLANVPLAAGQNRTDVDFGYRGTASIGDRLWYDTDGDGTQDIGETGISGVTVQLRDSGGTIIAIDLTDGGGIYGFGNLDAGTYNVTVDTSTLPAGYGATYDLDGGNDSAASVTLTAGQNRTDVDFGYRGTASIGDRLWYDTDGDGTQDGGEAALSGVTVELRDAFGTVIATDVTDGGGIYGFGDLDAGTYNVTVDTSTLPAGLTATYDLDAGDDSAASVTLAGGQNRTDVDFGYRGTASIGDRLWFDTDGDGTQDIGETGLSGVTVQLRDSGGTIIATDVTDGGGIYGFGDLGAGSYNVTVDTSTLPAGLTETYDLDAGDDSAAAVSLAAGQNRTDVDFGYTGTASIGDTVWFDTDGDGAQDAGEAGIAGVTVELRDGGGTLIATDVTDGSGVYGFPRLRPGTYTVTVVTSSLPAGQTATFDLDGGDDSTTSVVLAADQNRTDVDFGYTGTASIGDTVWFDLDGNGALDAGEPGIGGVTVELRDGGGTVVATDVTDGSGAYGFGNLVPDTYTVTVDTSTLPAGFTETYDLDGGDDSTASAPLADGQNRTDVDFGYTGTGALGDTVWFDTDGNGTQGAGEPGIPAVTVDVVWYGPNGTAGDSDDVAFTTVTDGSGTWSVDGLPAGPYSVTVVGTTLPGGLENVSDPDGTPDSTTTTTLADGETDLEQDFGYRGTGSIGDTVWFDTDGDGVQDAGETGLPDIDITVVGAGFDGVLDTADDLVFETTTGSDGGYVVDGLPAGPYRVTVDEKSLGANLEPTFDLDGGMDHTTELTLGDGEDRDDADFGYEGLGTIGDVVWHDEDGDGEKDADEPGIPGVTVELLDADGNVIDSTTTAKDGSYLFVDVPFGDYQVRVLGSTVPPEFRPSYDPDGVLDQVASVSVGYGENVADINFGYQTVAADPTPTPTPNPAPTPAPAPAPTPTSLAATGANIAGAVLVAMLLIALGGLAAVTGRRRETTD